MRKSSKPLGGVAAGALLGVVAGVLAGCSREPLALSVAKGQEALRNGEYEQAAKHLRRAARSNSDSAVLQFNLGMAELEAGHLPKAAAAFSRAAALTADGNTDALEALARVRHLQHRWDDANAAYEQAIQKAGRRPRLLAAMAATELANQRGEAAIGLLAEALAQDPEEPAALYNMACVQRDAFSDPAAAVAYFNRFLEVTPASEAPMRAKATTALDLLGGVRPATSARAESLIVKSRQATVPAEAAVAAEQAAHEDPLSADAAWNLAIVMETKVQDTGRAALAYATFAKRFPEDSRVTRIPPLLRSAVAGDSLAAARAAVAAGSWSAAVAAYRNVLSVDPKAVGVWLELSDAARSANDGTLAVDAASKALELKAEDPEALYRLGYLHHQKGLKQKSIEYYRRYLKVAPSGPQKDAIQKWLRTSGG